MCLVIQMIIRCFKKWARILGFSTFIFILFLVSPSQGNGSGNPTNKWEERLKQFYQELPRQKVFLHSDKDEYLAGETIWFKAYVVDGHTLKPDTLSTNLHVKVTSARGDLVFALLLKLNKGTAHGNMLLPDSLIGGNYQIMAFTDWMKNFNPTHYFTKDIYIYNPIEENFARRSDLRRNRRFNRELAAQEETMQFACFPEGGNLVAGRANRVAFKAANALGSGVSASGQIYDSNGNKVTDFMTHFDGMGAFSITPQHGETYSASILFENGHSKEVKLPVALNGNITLSVKDKNDYFEVEAIRNRNEGRQPDETFFLLVKSQGTVLHLKPLEPVDKESVITITKKDISSGIVQFTLLSEYGYPISERIVFVNHNDINQVNIIDHSADETGSKHTIMIKSPFAEKGTWNSHSLAVLDTDNEHGIVNMAAELLFLNDIDYRAEDAWLLLDADSKKSTKAMDLVMMTHGWKRYDLKEILQEEWPQIEYGFPDGLIVSGQVTPKASGRKPGQVSVELMVFEEDPDISKTSDFYNTVTDEDGLFEFTGIQQEGPFTAGMRVERGADGRIMEIELHEREYDVKPYEKNRHTRLRKVTSRGNDWERVSRPETALESRRFFKPGGQEAQSLYGQADQVIYFDDIRDQVANMMDVLRTRVRGLRIIDGEITLRGISSMVVSNEPIFMIDEVIVDRSAFLNVNVRQVDRLAVLSGSQAAMLGSRGTNGALLVYTLRGSSLMDRTYEFMMQGYHKPAETFESKIHTDLNAVNHIDRTLFWKPNLVLDQDSFTFSFETDQHVRNLRLILQGIDENGRITFTDILIENGEQ